jgi:hypothetical protein
LHRPTRLSVQARAIQTLLGSDLMTTPLYPTFRKRIDDGIERIIKQQVTPWVFMTAGPPFRVKMFDGKQIGYEGVEFEGSPRGVFWSRYIEPFLEDLCISEIGAAVAMAKERGVDARLLLPELQDLLSAGCRRVYTRMAKVDRRLRGKGYPNKVQPRSIDAEVSAMTQFIEERIRAELEMWKPKSRVELWYERNKFWVWAIGIFVTILVTILGLLAKFG